MYLLTPLFALVLTSPANLAKAPFIAHAAFDSHTPKVAIVEAVDPKDFSKINSPAESIFEDDFGN